MTFPEVTIIDYGVGNLLSVRCALEHCGALVSITNEPDAVLAASRVVLPGVGAFGNAMAELSRLDLVEAIREVAKRGTPLLGICLGMQLLLEESEEFGLTKGLGLIRGRVIPIPSISVTGQPQKVPHIGWNNLTLPSDKLDWQDSILQAVKPGSSVYFVHSFMAKPEDPRHVIAYCLYGGISIGAVLECDNVSGCQFHPEKSGEVGLKVLRRFLSL